MNYSLCLLSLAAALLAFCALPAGADAEFAFKEISQTALQLSENGKPVYVYNFGMTLAQRVPGEDGPRRAYRPSGLCAGWHGADRRFSEGPGPRPPPRHLLGLARDRRYTARRTIFGPSRASTRSSSAGSRETKPDSARLAVENGWYDGAKRFVKENVEIVAHSAEGSRRALDFTLRFEAASDPVTIVGTPDQKKGYGGFAMRFATPDGGGSKTIITTDQGVSPKDGVMSRHPWAQISGVYKGRPAGARIEDDPSNPGYPNNGWLMRHELCALNVSYPGLDPIVLIPGKPLVLKYRVILFAGEAP